MDIGREFPQQNQHEPGEPIAEVTKAGASFLALIRHKGAVPVRGRATRRGLLSVAS